MTLIALATSGDATALAELYDRHAPLIHSVLTQKLGDPIESQDILHDLFIKLHSQKANYNPALGKPLAWLLTMARNAATDKLRRRATHMKYALQHSLEVETTSPGHPTVHGDEFALLHRCISILDKPHRDTLQLAYFSGLTQQEISTAMKQPLGSVKAWIRRGLIKLRDCVEGNL